MGTSEKPAKSRGIPRTVVVLGIVSFFNDLASEMVYPIVPIFLTAVLHTTVPVIGFIEGFAEAVASLSKYLFGTYSDYLGKRKVFVTVGYSFGALSKILIGLAAGWPFVLFARFVDRIGKGIRTAPRDSLLLENATDGNRGYVFGFHRSLDSLGAVFGPLVALALMYFLHENLRLMFFLASVPGIAAVILLALFVREKKKPVPVPAREFVRMDIRQLKPKLREFILVGFVFALGNSSDTFLLLHARNLGLSTTLVVAAYVLYNVTQAAFSVPAGKLSDKLGARRVYAGGLLVFSLVYLAFGLAPNSTWLWLLFPVYGLYIAATDGVSKAYISEFVEKKESGTFFGAYYTLNALGAFLASIVGGILWSRVGPAYAFYFGSVMAALAFVLLGIFRKSSRL